MKYVSLPNDEQHRLCFYLAMEEYVAQTLVDDDDCFFMWQVEPTVIFGRHQVIENEVNIDYCKENGIQFYRRKSGGGCVYADRNNVMLSYITRDDNVEKTFDHYMGVVADALSTILGIDTVKTQNNDLLIGDAKVSGNAIYHIDREKGCAEYGRLLVDKINFPEKGLGSAITYGASEIACKDLGLSMLYSEIYESNLPSMYAHLKVGFHEVETCMLNDHQKIYYLENTFEQIRKDI